MPKNQKKAPPGLFEAVTALLEQKVKIGILVVDEITQSSDNMNPNDAHVDIRQEQVLHFANKLQLPVWFIETSHNTRPELYKLSKTCVAVIEKGDANGFGVDILGNEHRLDNIPRFIDTGLNSSLQQLEITHLIIMGFHVDCCVQITAGATLGQQHYGSQPYSDFGRGAIQYGYSVFISGDTLRSSKSFPTKDGDRCEWKNFPGVTYFDTISARAAITLEDFKTEYGLQYQAAFFKNPRSSMKKLIETEQLTSIDAAIMHAENNPSKRTEQVFLALSGLN